MSPRPSARAFRVARALFAAPGLLTLLGVAGLGLFLHGWASPLAGLALGCAGAGAWAALRRQPGLPEATVLSIIALAGWGLADRWQLHAVSALGAAAAALTWWGALWARARNDEAPAPARRPGPSSSGEPEDRGLGR